MAAPSKETAAAGGDEMQVEKGPEAILKGKSEFLWEFLSDWCPMVVATICPWPGLDLLE